MVYNPDLDIDALSPIDYSLLTDEMLGMGHGATPSQVKTVFLGHNPLDILLKYGDRLKILDQVLQNAVNLCVKNSDDVRREVNSWQGQILGMYLCDAGDRYYLNEQWAYEAGRIFPELLPPKS